MLDCWRGTVAPTFLRFVFSATHSSAKPAALAGCGASICGTQNDETHGGWGDAKKVPHIDFLAASPASSTNFNLSRRGPSSPGGK
eukprot:s2028_g10.t1